MTLNKVEWKSKTQKVNVLSQIERGFDDGDISDSDFDIVGL